MKKTPNKQSFLFKQLLRAFVLPLLVLAIHYQKAAAQATVSNFIFKQYDRYNKSGSLLFANSSLGSVSVSPVNNTGQTQYLNIYGRTQSGSNAWLVQNYPLPAQATACQQVDVDYKYLDIYPGNPVYTVTYNYTVTPARVVAQVATDTVIVIHHDHDSIRNTFNANSRSYNISKNQFRSFNELRTDGGIGISPGPVSPTPVSTAYVVKDRFRNEESYAYNEFLNSALYTLPAVIVDTPVGHDVPPVQEGGFDCLPGAFARSIAWLNTKYNLGYPGTPQQIFDSLKKLVDTCFGKPNAHGCRLKTKSDFLKAITGGRGTTTISITDTTIPFTVPAGLPQGPKPANIGDFVKDKLKDCDVEMVYNATGPGPFNDPDGNCHMVTITRIQCGADGCCTIWFRDDETQGTGGTGDSCEKSMRVCGDSFTRYGGNRKIWYFVVECVPPAAGKITAPAAPVTNPEPAGAITLLQNTPNPFGSNTTIGIRVQEGAKIGVAQLIIRNAHGNEVQRIRLNLRTGLNNIQYQPGRDAKGLLYYSLQVDGQTIATRQMMTELQ